MMIRIRTRKCELCASVIFKKYVRCSYKLYSSQNTGEFAGGYNPRIVESKKYENWEKRFPAKSSKEEKLKPFSLIVPPPNITGTLHLGHALTLTVQDVLVRWNKMRGNETLWIPGMDHAGIATQVVVEKKLWQEEKKTRHDIGRVNFEAKVWKWKYEKSDIIRQQVKRLGAVPDWSREYFTMDDKQSRAVNEAFIRLYDSGLIYRSDYLVNWSCVLQSAISDIEVEYLDIPGRAEITVPGYEQTVPFGVLTKFAYKLCEMDDELIVSTTRPETVLGDVAIAVHPSDERYTSFKGKHVIHPFRNEPIPVICDDFVDPEFGTGVVKVTPAHDPVDFEVGKRHRLPMLQVIDDRGNIMNICGSDMAADGRSFTGMKRFLARKAITERLDTLGLLRSIEEHPMSVPICSRSGDVVEHLIRPQWFVNCRGMARQAVQDVEQGRLIIEPRTFEKVWFNWLENIRDWCISRQLWWGHRVPAYQCHVRHQPEGNRVWVAADNPTNARLKASVKLSAAPEDIAFEQDEDVLDTWFSSALLPFSLFGWPDKTPELNRYYPLSVMETGHDILFFWVARMVMLGSQLTGKLPFEKILLHGIICDVHGRKMSKSSGNVIAPEDVISGITLESLKLQAQHGHVAGLLSSAEMERTISGQTKMFPSGIPECGADALRYTLCSHNIKSHFINFDINECYTNKLFCNKIWQALKYIRMACEKVPSSLEVQFEDLSVMDKWILSRMSLLVTDVNEALHRNDFHVATSSLKQFLYSDFCDVYLETTKPALRSSNGPMAIGHVNTLVQCFDTGLRCLCPFMPFLTDELYKYLPANPVITKYESVMESPYPQSVMSNWRDVRLEEKVQIALDTVTVIRRLMKLSNMSVKQEPKVHIITTHNVVYEELKDTIATLSGCRKISLATLFESAETTNTVSDTVGNYATVHLLTASQNSPIDKNRMSKKIDKLIVEVEKMKIMINAVEYKSKAPLKVQEAHSKKLLSLTEEIQRLQLLQQQT